MKKALLLLSAVLISSLAIAQRTTTVRGTIVDAANNQPLVGAFISIDSVFNGVADIKGEFTIKNVPVKQSTVVASFLGYTTYKQSVNISGTNVNLGIMKLSESANMVEKIVIEGDVVVATQKGDTTQYNAAAFKTNPDAYTGDLVSKLPGAEVTDTSIKIQGETVKRVYVDGKLFFGDDPMAAINNLPAEAVESIQMFDEKSDEAKFTGFDDGSMNRALNIITKYKLKVAGLVDVSAGYGKELDRNMDDKYQDRYSLSVNSNLFLGQRMMMVGGTFNNTNSTTGRRGYGRGGGMGGLNTISQFNIGYAQEIPDKLKFNVDYRYNGNKAESYKRTLDNYFSTEQYVLRTSQDTTNSLGHNYSHNGNMRIEYTLNRNNKIFFSPNVSFSNSDSYSLRSTSSLTSLTNNGGDITNRNQTSTTSDSKNYSVGGNLMWLRNLGKAGRFLSVSGNVNISENDANNLQLDTIAASTNPRNITTLSSGWNRSFTARVNYAEPLSVSSQLSVNYSFRYQNSKSDRIAYNNLNNKIDSILSNVYTRNYTTNSVGTRYNYTKGNTRFSMGLNYEMAHLNKDQELPILTQSIKPYNFNNLLPSVEYRYNLEKTKFIRASYNTSVDLPSIENLQNVIDYSNPLRLSAGNTDLKQSYTHNMMFMYNTTNIAKSTTFNAFVRATATRNNSSTRTVFFAQDTVLADYNNFEASKGSQLSTPVNLNGKYTFDANATYSINIKPLKTRANFSLNYGFDKNPGYTNALLNYAKANSLGLRIGFESNVSQNVDFSISSSSNYQYVTNSSFENKSYFKEAVRASTNLIFLGGFVFSTDITYNFDKSFSSDGYTQSYTVWNAGLGRKFMKKRQAEFRITMYDILKQNKNFSHTISNDRITDTWTNTIGRYVMATFSYKFNSLNELQKNSRRGGFDENSGPRTRGEGGGMRGGQGGGMRGGMPMSPMGGGGF